MQRKKQKKVVHAPNCWRRFAGSTSGVLLAAGFCLRVSACLALRDFSISSPDDGASDSSPPLEEPESASATISSQAA
jgi:hypothetical protein